MYGRSTYSGLASHTGRHGLRNPWVSDLHDPDVCGGAQRARKSDHIYGEFLCYRTTKIKSLEENVATGQVHLEQDEIDQLQTVIKAAEVGGDRYPQGVGANLYADTPAMD